MRAVKTTKARSRLCGEVGDDSELWHRVMELLLENLLQKSQDTGDQQRCLIEAIPDVGSTDCNEDVG